MAPPTRQAASDGAARSRTVQPRRKVSQSHGQQQSDSWELLAQQSTHQRSAQRVNGSNDMDVDTSPLHAESITPLREMAERVGREVELFAEKLDTWKPKPHERAETRQRAAIDLANDYRRIAYDIMSRLQKQHGSELERLLKKHWDRASRASNADGEDDADTMMDEDGAEEIDTRMKTTVKDLEQWQAEFNTWALVCDLLESRYSDQNAHDQARTLAFSNDNDRFMADGDPWVGYLSSHESAREKLVVMRWLEKTAEQTGNDLDIIEEQLEKASEQGKSLFGLGWMNTRERLKGEKRLRLWETPIDSGIPEIKDSEGTQLLVTQLDYDAPNRLNLTLEKADRTYESSFYLMCWEMLKRGKSMDDIREWCADRHEFARAVSVGAHPFEHSNQHPTLDIAARFRWRQACGVLSQMGGVSRTERAVYGLLAGDYASSERCCQNWNDHVWASYNSQILGEYNTYVIEHYPDMIPDYYKEALGRVDNSGFKDIASWARGVIASLQLKKTSHLDANHALKLIQASILSHDFQDTALRQGVALSRQRQQRATVSHLDLIQSSAAQLISDKEDITRITDDPNGLRILSHLILLFGDLGLDFGSGETLMAVENVICCYINFLKLSGKFNLIPLYASMLSKDRATTTMARVLFDIVDADERNDILQLMEASGLDRFDVLRAQYEFAVEYSRRGKKSEENFTGLKIMESAKDDIWPGSRIMVYQPGHILADEQILIQCLEWFTLVKGQWTVSFAAFTDVATRFLSCGCMEAAIELFHRLPFSEVSKALTSDQLGNDVEVMYDHDGNDDISHGLRRSARTRSTFEAFRRARSVTPSRDKVLRDVLKHQARTFHDLDQLVAGLEALWNWRAAEDDLLERASYPDARQSCRTCLEDLVMAMEPLMHEFLQHPGPADNADQLERIRRLYLPEMIMGYISALHSAGHLLTREHLLSIMTLATEIADNPVLIECFSATQRMPELVDALAISSKTMLRLNEESPKTGKKKKLKNGRNLGMWEIAA